MTIQKTQDGNVVTLHVEGRVDTLTSPELQSAILSAFQSAPNVVLDLEQLIYISSAGLRALLIGQKTAASKSGSFELHHVTAAVMSILETVGFSSILTVR